MIRSVEKALAILTFVAESASEPVPLGEIARGLGMNAGTCAHIVDTMCQCHYLEKISRTEGYIIGPLAYSITTSRAYRMELIRVASPYMMRLCRDLKENVSLSTYTQAHLYVPYTINYREPHVERRGTLRGKIYGSASGRTILAYMEPRERAELLAKVGRPSAAEWPEAVGEEEMERTLSAIRQAGACIAPRVNGDLSAVACPIVERGRVRAAVGTSMNDQRFEGEHLEDAVRFTQRAAGAITRRLAGEVE